MRMAQAQKTTTSRRMQATMRRTKGSSLLQFLKSLLKVQSGSRKASMDRPLTVSNIPQKATSMPMICCLTITLPQMKQFSMQTKMGPNAEMVCTMQRGRQTCDQQRTKECTVKMKLRMKRTLNSRAERNCSCSFMYLQMEQVMTACMMYRESWDSTKDMLCSLPQMKPVTQKKLAIETIRQERLLLEIQLRARRSSLIFRGIIIS